MSEAAASGEETAAPFAKLASVTRKKNEIEELLGSKSDLSMIKQFYNEYLVRVENLITSCGEQHQDW